MKVIEEGHIYELKSYEGMGDQTIKFISKNGGNIVHDGTTNEEVLEVLIDRMKSLNSKFPCRENSLVITKLEESLMWLERRTSLRVKQQVEGQDLPHIS